MRVSVGLMDVSFHSVNIEWKASGSFKMTVRLSVFLFLTQYLFFFHSSFSFLSCILSACFPTYASADLLFNLSAIFPLSVQTLKCQCHPRNK